MVHQQDLRREGKGAEDQQHVAPYDGERFRHAQQVQPGPRQCHRQPHHRAHPVPEQQAVQRHDQDVQRGQETRLARGGLLQPELLQVDRGEQHQPAQRAADEQGAPVPPPGSAFLPFYNAVIQQDDRPERKGAQEGAHRLEGKGTDVAHAQALGDKGAAPDDGGGQQHQASGPLVPVHMRTPPPRMMGTIVGFAVSRVKERTR